MLHVRVMSPSDLTDQVVEIFEGDPAVSSLAVLRDASVRPQGDVVLADVAREAANELVDRLTAIGLPQVGTVHIDPVVTWISQAGLESERRTPGSSSDAVVWADVTQRAYEESELNWTYLAFMTMATLLAGIAIVLDSQILVIGAMVLGPEFVAVAALGLALVRRRAGLFAVALRTSSSASAWPSPSLRWRRRSGGRWGGSRQTTSRVPTGHRLDLTPDKWSLTSP